MDPYYLVKIPSTASFAERLLDGEVYMSPLSSFGDLEFRDRNSQNSFRGDVLEGLSQTFTDPDQSAFFRDALDGTHPRGAVVGQIAECFLQERVFCLYCLEYSEQLAAFRAPDGRVSEFGPVAIIILEPLTFLRRLVDAMFLKFKDSFWVGAKRVQYVDVATFTKYDEFTKHTSYSWQNEFRVALDLSCGHADNVAWKRMTDACRVMFLQQGGTVDHGAQREATTVTVGDIRDICAVVDTSELIDLRLPLGRLTALTCPHGSYQSLCP